MAQLRQLRSSRCLERQRDVHLLDHLSLLQLGKPHSAPHAEVPVSLWVITWGEKSERGVSAPTDSRDALHQVPRQQQLSAQ